MPPSAFIEHPIMDGVRSVLETEGFTVRSLDLPEIDVTVLAAEDEYSLAAIVAADRWGDVRDHVTHIDVALGNWVAGTDAGGKRWDIYLVCLLQDRLKTPAEFAEAEASEGDTRRVRKYVRDGVLPDYDEVRTALSPLLSLNLPTLREPIRPLEMLEAKLRERGVQAESARLAIEGFERGKSPGNGS